MTLLIKNNRYYKIIYTSGNERNYIKSEYGVIGGKSRIHIIYYYGKNNNYGKKYVDKIIKKKLNSGYRKDNQ